MIKSITAINPAGDKLVLTLDKPDQEGLIVKSITGLGPSKANVSLTDLASIDGSMYNSARVGTRNIVLTLVPVDGSEVETYRQNTYRYFPLKKEVRLIVQTKNRRVTTTGYVESNEPEIFTDRTVTQISIVCPDPYFYSYDDDSSITVDLRSVKPLFEFPFSNESLTMPILEFGDIRRAESPPIFYNGDDSTGFTINIHATGDAKNLTIYNMLTPEKMTIDTAVLKATTGSEILAGDDIVISTRRGKKSAIMFRNGAMYNIINSLGRASDWLLLRQGENKFAYSAEVGAENLSISFDYQRLYVGV